MAANKKWFLNNEIKKLRERIKKIEQGGFGLYLKEFEQGNLLRLGLIRQLPPKIYIEEFSTGGHGDEQWHQIEADYDPDDYGYRLADLGRKFIAVCEVKK